MSKAYENKERLGSVVAIFSGTPSVDSDIFLIPLYLHYYTYAETVTPHLSGALVHNVNNELQRDYKPYQDN